MTKDSSFSQSMSNLSHGVNMSREIAGSSRQLVFHDQEMAQSGISGDVSVVKLEGSKFVVTSVSETKLLTTKYTGVIIKRLSDNANSNSTGA
jgi:hypothetical protein